jgi:hypothetical protein
VDALSIAARGSVRSGTAARQKDEFDVYRAVRDFAPQLKLLDSVDPPTETFYTGIIAAALLALSLDPTAIEFFRRLSRSQGSKRQGLVDPVEGILRLIDHTKKKRARLASRQELLCSETLAALDIWKGGDSALGYWSDGSYQGVPLLDVVRRVHELRLSTASRP